MELNQVEISKILLVSSNADYRAVLRQSVIEKGCEVISEVGTIQESYAMYVLSDPSCIVIDLMPDKMQSITLLRRFRIHAEDARIIAITDIHDPQLATLLKSEMLAQGYFSKVWGNAAFRFVLNRVLKDGKLIPVTKEDIEILLGKCKR